MTEDQRLINTGGSRLRHTPSFDGFRGIGVLIVVFYHAEVLSWMGGAPILIDWFFIASGFLITMIILDEREATGTNSFRRFYERRVLRLFPAMYIMIAVFSILMSIAMIVSSEAREQLGNWWIDALGAATYSYYLVAAIIPNKVTGALGHTWSLTLEEQFYFIWPVVLISVLNKARRVTDRRLITGMVIFIVTMIGLRVGLHYMVEIGGSTEAVGAIRYVDKDHPTLAGIIYRIAGVRPDSIAYGCLLAFAFKRLPNPLAQRWRRLLGIAGAIGCITMVVYFFIGNRFVGLRVFNRGVFDLLGGPAYNITLLLMGVFILDLYVRPDGLIARGLSFKPLTWLGIRSYGIYLWHVPVLLPVLPAIQNSWGARGMALGTVAGAMGVLAGVLSFRFIEKPFLHIKDTRFRRPQDLIGAQADRQTS